MSARQSSGCERPGITNLSKILDRNMQSVCFFASMNQSTLSTFNFIDFPISCSFFLCPFAAIFFCIYIRCFTNFSPYCYTSSVTMIRKAKGGHEKSRPADEKEITMINKGRLMLLVDSVTRCPPLP